jgi:DNA-binding transcriptional LysR family regulator
MTPVPVMQLDSVESIKVLVAGGLGASIVPKMALSGDMPATVTRRLRPACRATWRSWCGGRRWWIADCGS